MADKLNLIWDDQKYFFYPDREVFRHGRWQSVQSQREEYDKYWRDKYREYELSREPTAPPVEGSVLGYLITFAIIIVLCIGMYSFYASVMKQGSGDVFTSGLR